MGLIPPVTHPVWEKLVTRKIQHKFSLFAANLKIELAVRDYEQDQPKKPQLIQHLHQFFDKYQKMTSVELDQLVSS